MTNTFFNDISNYQAPVNNNYPYFWLSFRCSVGYTQTDTNLAANLAWAKANSGPGKRMAGFTFYHVYYPNNADAQIAWIKSRIGDPGRFSVFMMDIESWGGTISGNHSAEINYIFTAIVAWLGGDWRRVWAYGNAGDLASIYAQPNAAVNIVIAGYSATEPGRKHLIWQYAGGGNNPAPAGFPLTGMWGKIDYNVAHITSVQLAAACGLPTNEEDEMVVMALNAAGTGWLLSDGWQSKFGMDQAVEWTQLQAAGAVIFKLSDAELNSIPTVGVLPPGQAAMIAELQQLHLDFAALSAAIVAKPIGQANVTVSLQPTITAS